MRHSVIHIVDDDEDVRASLALLLNTQGYVTTQHASAQSFLDGYDAGVPGCLLLDVRMPGLTGLDLQDLLNQKHIRIPTIFMSGHGNIPTSVKALKAGAMDFLEKPFDKGVLMQRVNEALVQDQKFRESESNRERVLGRYGSLTPREKQVMAQVVEGKSNKKIAKKLDISHRTVELHRTRMMAKMQAMSIPNLVAMAMICGIHQIAGFVRDQE